MGRSKKCQLKYDEAVNKMRNLTPPVSISWLAKEFNIAYYCIRQLLNDNNLEYLLGTEEDQKRIKSENNRLAAIARESAKTQQQKEENIKRLTEGRKKWYDSLSEEEKKEFNNSRLAYLEDEQKMAERSIKLKTIHENRTAEEYAKIYKKCVKTMHDHFTDKEIDEIRKEQGRKLSEHLQNLTEEERLARNAKTGAGIQRFHDNETAEHKQATVEKINKTCLERYNCDWFVLTSAVRKSGAMHSKINKKFAEKLNSYGISYEEEFVIKNKSFDFKIGKYLVEINPSATHNINWNPFNGLGGLSKDYHRNKTKLAEENGYICVQLFDWLDEDKIIFAINNNTLKTVDTCECKLVKYNIKTKTIVDNSEEITAEVVEVIDDGYTILLN